MRKKPGPAHAGSGTSGAREKRKEKERKESDVHRQSGLERTCAELANRQTSKKLNRVELHCSGMESCKVDVREPTRRSARDVARGSSRMSTRVLRRCAGQV